MPEEAAVILTAQDGISDAIQSAIASLKSLQDAQSALDSAMQSSGSASARAGDGISLAGAASAASLVPHRAAHQALNLITMDMAQMAGSSPAASGAIHVVNSAMFALATGVGGASLAFLGIVGAVVGVVAGLKSVYDSAKKTDEELQKITDSAVKAAMALNTPNASQMSVVGVGAGQLAQKVLDLKTQIADLNQKMRENAETMTRMDANSNGAATGASNLSKGWQAVKNVFAGLSGVADPVVASQVKMAGQLRALKETLEQTQQALKNTTTQMSVYKSKMDDLGNPLLTYAAGLEREAADIEKVGLAMGGTIPTIMDWASAGRKAADQMKQAMAQMVSSVTDALATLLVSGQATWDTMFANMLKTAGAAMKQIGEMWLAMDLMVSLGVGPQSIGPAIALIAAGSLVEAVAAKMQSKNAISTGFDSSAASSAGTASGATGAAAGSGAGGNAVSSTQQNVNNYITVSLPVEALDLSSVSDSQMRSLANRLARIISQGASGGQFSLVGA